MAITTPLEWPAEDRVREALRNVQGHFLEMPGLRLTEAQVAKLCALDRITCSAVLRRLVNARVLTQTRSAIFALAAEIDAGA